MGLKAHIAVTSCVINERINPLQEDVRGLHLKFNQLLQQFPCRTNGTDPDCDSNLNMGAGFDGDDESEGASRAKPPMPKKGKENENRMMTDGEKMFHVSRVASFINACSLDFPRRSFVNTSKMN